VLPTLQTYGIQLEEIEDELNPKGRIQSSNTIQLGHGVHPIAVQLWHTMKGYTAFVEQETTKNNVIGIIPSNSFVGDTRLKEQIAETVYEGTVKYNTVRIFNIDNQKLYGTVNLGQAKLLGNFATNVVRSQKVQLKLPDSNIVEELDPAQIYTATSYENNIKIAQGNDDIAFLTEPIVRVTKESIIMETHSGTKYVFPIEGTGGVKATAQKITSCKPCSGRK